MRAIALLAITSTATGVFFAYGQVIQGLAVGWLALMFLFEVGDVGRTSSNRADKSNGPR